MTIEEQAMNTIAKWYSEQDSSRFVLGKTGLDSLAESLATALREARRQAQEEIGWKDYTCPECGCEFSTAVVPLDYRIQLAEREACANGLEEAAHIICDWHDLAILDFEMKYGQFERISELFAARATTVREGKIKT